MTSGQTSEQTRAWLAGAATRLADPAVVDDLDEVRRRVGQLTSTVDGPAGVWLDCPRSDLDAGPYTVDEAGQHAGTHDDLLHYGHPTALVVAVAR